MVSYIHRELAALSSGWLAGKLWSQSCLLVSLWAWLRSQQGLGRCGSFVLPDANNGRKRGFYDFLFLRRLTDSSTPGKTYVILQNGMSH